MKYRSVSFLTFVGTLTLAAMSSPTVDAATCSVWRMMNSNTPFYLVGSLHALSGNDHPLPAPYQEALRSSQRIVFEFNHNQTKEFGEKFRAAGKYPQGQDIRRHIHPQTYQYLVRAFQLSRLNPNAFLPYKPWVLANLWGIRGYSDIRYSHGVDNYFYQQALRAHKEVAGLESVGEHVAVMSGMSDIESELTLLDSIVRYNKNVKGSDYDQLHRAWRQGDMATLWALEQRSQTINPGGTVRLLDARNVKWVPRIKEHIKSNKPTAIVCGVNHMLGPNGLLALLHRNGYEFEQL